MNAKVDAAEAQGNVKRRKADLQQAKQAAEKNRWLKNEAASRRE